MTGVKWQGAIIVSSWWKHPSQLDIWSRCGLSAWAQRSHSVTRVLLCWRTNARAKNIQCQMTIRMFDFSNKTVSAKLGCRGWGGGSTSFSHKGAGPFSVHPLQKKKMKTQEQPHFFQGEYKHNAQNYRRTVQTRATQHTQEAAESSRSEMDTQFSVRWKWFPPFSSFLQYPSISTSF